MTTTVTTSVTLKKGDVVFVDAELMRVTASLSGGTYGLVPLGRWRRWWMKMWLRKTVRWFLVGFAVWWLIMLTIYVMARY